jgi:predicted nucleic acid-binding protein
VDRVFLDANILYAAAYREGSPLATLWRLPNVELWTSEYAVGEALANLTEDRPERAGELHRLIGLMRVTPTPATSGTLPADVSLPAKDRPILAAAVQVEAAYLLTGDKIHFGPLFGQTVTGVRILSPAQYLSSRG